LGGDEPRPLSFDFGGVEEQQTLAVASWRWLVFVDCHGVHILDWLPRAARHLAGEGGRT
jgi:hypothetical protein